MNNELQEASEKTYRAIGRFIYAFSQGEYTIREYVALAIGLNDKYFLAVVGSYDVAMLCTIAVSVFEKSLPEYKAAKLKSLINDFHNLNRIRNRVAHGLWVPFRDGGTVHHTSRQTLKSNPSANQAESLEKLADKAFHIRAEIEIAFHELEGNSSEMPSAEAWEEIRRNFPPTPDSRDPEPDEWWLPSD